MDPTEQQTQIALDENHWWYRGRRRYIRAALDGLEFRAGARILDAGCGSGRTLDDLAGYGQVSGIDLSEFAASAARARGHADVHVGRVEELPWADASFDLVTALDVVEHTPDDRATLAEMRRVTRPLGHALITVPAYQWLFSAHDVVNHHYRRYSLSVLTAAAQEAGWTVDWTAYFNSILLAPAAVVRMARYRGSDQPKRRSDFEITPRSISALLELPMWAEAALLRRGLRLPAGLSLLALLTNPGGATDTPARDSLEPTP
jgi:SAM-dependent methyltransferase